MGTTELKVKLKSLAAESRIIRLEEQRAKNGYRWAKHELGKLDDRPHTEAETAALEQQHEERVRTFWSLRVHRKGTVGYAFRTAHLAYGFLRGLPYRALESSQTDKRGWSYVMDEARSNAARFGGKAFDPEAWKAWVKAAEEHLEEGAKEKARKEKEAREARERALLAAAS